MYIGNIPAENYASFLTQTFSVTATASYTLDHAVSNENDIRLVINNVVQQPGSGKAYTASGTTLTLSEATASTDVMYCVYLGRALQTVNPPNASVGTSQLVDGAVSSSKLSSGKILQVVNSKITTQETTTSTSFVATQLSLNITPISSSNKILLLGNSALYNNAAAGAAVMNIFRDTSTSLGKNTGEAWGLGYIYNGGDNIVGQVSPVYLDTPSTTSQINYKVYIRRYNAGTCYISYDSTPSTLTALEVSA